MFINVAFMQGTLLKAGSDAKHFLWHAQCKYESRQYIGNLIDHLYFAALL